MVQNLQLVADKFGIKDIDSVKLQPEMVDIFLTKVPKRLRESFRTRNAQRHNEQRRSPRLERSDRAQSAATADDPINLCSDDEDEEVSSNEEYVTPPTSPLPEDLDEDIIERKYEFYKFLHENMSKLKISQPSHTAESRSATMIRSRQTSRSIEFKAYASSSHIAPTSSHRVSKRTHKGLARLRKESKSAHRSSKSFQSPFRASSSSHKTIPKGPKEYVSQDIQLRWSKTEGLPREPEMNRRTFRRKHSSKHAERRNSLDKEVDYMVISDDEESGSVNDDNDDISNSNGNDTVEEDVGDVANDEDIYDIIEDIKADPFAVTSSKEIQSFFNHPVRQQDVGNQSQNSTNVETKGNALQYKSIEQMLGFHSSGGTSQGSSNPLCPKESRGGVCFDPYCPYSHCKDFE